MFGRDGTNPARQRLTISSAWVDQLLTSAIPSWNRRDLSCRGPPAIPKGSVQNEKSARSFSDRINFAEPSRTVPNFGFRCGWFGVFGGPGFRTSWQSSARPKTLLRCLEKWSRERRDASPQSTCRTERNPGPENPKSVTSRSVTWWCLIVSASHEKSQDVFSTYFTWYRQAIHMANKSKYPPCKTITKMPSVFLTLRHSFANNDIM